MHEEDALMGKAKSYQYVYSTISLNKANNTITPSILKKPDVLGVVLIFAKPDVLDAPPLRGRVYP